MFCTNIPYEKVNSSVFSGKLLKKLLDINEPISYILAKFMDNNKLFSLVCYVSILLSMVVIVNANENLFNIFTTITAKKVKHVFVSTDHDVKLERNRIIDNEGDLTYDFDNLEGTCNYWGVIMFGHTRFGYKPFFFNNHMYLYKRWGIRRC